MFCSSFQPNDCEVGVAEGKLFITGVTRCCHGNIINKTTMWFTPELVGKLQVVANYEELKNVTKPRWKNHQ